MKIILQTYLAVGTYSFFSTRLNIFFLYISPHTKTKYFCHFIWARWTYAIMISSLFFSIHYNMMFAFILLYKNLVFGWFFFLFSSCSLCLILLHHLFFRSRVADIIYAPNICSCSYLIFVFNITYTFECVPLR